MKQRLRVLLVDDHEVFLRSAARLLAERPELDVVASVKGALRGLELIDSLNPDVVVMEAFMRGLDGMTATRLIKSTAQPPRVVLMSQGDCAEHCDRCLRAGADACISKGDFAQTIFGALSPQAEEAG